MSASIHLNTYYSSVSEKYPRGPELCCAAFPSRKDLLPSCKECGQPTVSICQLLLAQMHTCYPTSSRGSLNQDSEAGLIRPGHCSLRHVNSDESICSTASPQEGSRLSRGFVFWLPLCPTLLWPLPFSSVDSKRATCTPFPSQHLFPSTQPVMPHLKK